MPAPLAKGLIIAASVLVAAGIAIYESPQVRQWVDQSRRKIAVALHSLGDDIQPRRPSEASEDYEARKKRREDLIRRNRNELIRQAREEGVAVDLDELAEMGKDDIEMAEVRNRSFTCTSQRSFDDLVGSDGMLRKDLSTATGVEASENNLRRRGMAGFAAGTAAAANPFSDDNVLFDHGDNDDNDEAPSPKEFKYVESRESSATVQADPVSPPASAPLVDLSPEADHRSQVENPQTASIPSSDIGDNDQAAQSFYSFASNDSMPSLLHPGFVPPPIHIDDDDIENVSAGTLTPRSEHSAFTGVSVIGSQADDIANFSSQNGDDHDARSEVFSEGGFTDAGFSEAGFSDIASQAGRGVMTPSSWTDVGSDDESEWGGPTQQGQVS